MLSSHGPNGRAVLGAVPTLHTMAESKDRKRISNTRNYKAIVSRTRQIIDPKPDRSRRFTALVVARNGSVLAADADSKEVCIFNRNGKQVKTSSLELLENEDYLSMVELSDGNLAVCGYNTEFVNVFTLNGECIGEFDQELESGKLGSPGGMAVNNDGQVFVISNSYSKVLVFNEKGNFQYSFQCEVPALGGSDDLTGVCIGSDGLLYITDYDSNRVLVFQQNGTFVHSFGSDTLNHPVGMAATKDGHLVVASSSESKLSIFTTGGECVHEVEDTGINMDDPTGVAVDNNGFIFVADHSSNVISVF